MNINSIINQGGNVQLVVSAADLKEVFLEWAGEREAQTNQKREDDCLSISETIELLKVTKPTLWRWHKSGYLVPFKVGRKPFYRKSDIERITNKRV